jgi:hypothetical protein
MALLLKSQALELGCQVTFCGEDADILIQKMNPEFILEVGKGECGHCRDIDITSGWLPP